jgi:hypothetical protein
MEHYTPHTPDLATYLPSTKRFVAAASLALAIGGGLGITAAQAQEHHQPPHQTSSSGQADLPPGWPITKGLPPKACRPGDPIDRQSPTAIGPFLAAIIDSRCEPPREQPYTNAHTEPNRTSPIIARVYDGQTVRLDCQTAGEPLGDDRNPNFTNPEWLIVTFPNLDQANQPQQGYVAAANMGQLNVGPEVPPCQQAPQAPQPPAPQASVVPGAALVSPSHHAAPPKVTVTNSPIIVQSPTTKYTRSPIATTVPSRSTVPSPLCSPESPPQDDP